MPFKEWFEQARSRLGVTLRGEAPVMEPNLSNGGFGGYRPGRRDPFGTQSMQLGGTQANMQQEAQPQSAWTRTGTVSGRTGIMTGYANAPQAPQWNADPYYGNGTQAQEAPSAAWQQPLQQGTAWNAQMPGPAWNQPQNGPAAWQQPAPQGTAWNSQPGTARNGRTQGTAYGTVPQMPQDPGNISYMPDTFADANGMAYRHVERVMQVVGVASCFPVIDFMRNGESVIVNLEAIGNDGEIQRCLDMLAGAAFTLSCSLTRIVSGQRAYLIAPQTVMVMQESGIARMSDYRGQPEEETYAASTGTGDERPFNRPYPDRARGARPSAGSSWYGR